MRNENDIQDYTNEFSDLQPTTQPKKLYELPRGAVFKVDDYPYLIKLQNLDGMFSFCVIQEGPDKGEVTHIRAYAPVVLWK